MNHELHPPRLMSDMNADPPRQNAFSGGRGGVGLKTRADNGAVCQSQTAIQ
jgi:hypothetical protein